MDVITYTLRGDDTHSDRYYREVATFADRVLAEGEARVGHLVDACLTSGCEATRTRGEYILELLTLGVLWRVYASAALALPVLLQQWLAGLEALRERSPRLKPAVDRLRGVLMAFFLRPRRRPPTALPAPSLARVDHLLAWLTTTGAFAEPVQRLAPWRDLLKGQPPAELLAHLTQVIALAAWFEAESEKALGGYTRRVEAFLAETQGRYRWREDAFLCGRRRVEYHLCMVATEVLNWALRPAFLATAQKVLLLPPCMRPQPDDRCRARPTPLGDRCAGCTPGCRIRALTGLGERLGFGVTILPGELSVFAQRGAPAGGDTVGIIGVSCVLTNANGGWRCRALGIPAQGILLDYCGCPWHWHEKGFSTDVNEGQVLRVLGLGDDTPRGG